MRIADKSSSVGSEECHEKVFYTISEVAKELGVEQHVLRFWESKFPQISPVKRRGRRLYDKGSIEVIKKVKYMLYNCGYTIKGAGLELQKKGKGAKISTKAKDELAKVMHSMVSMRNVLLRKLDGM